MPGGRSCTRRLPAGAAPRDVRPRILGKTYNEASPEKETHAGAVRRDARATRSATKICYEILVKI